LAKAYTAGTYWCTRASICEAYLIVKLGFLPMGVGCRRELPVFDLVGRSPDGKYIHAHRKGKHNSMRIEEEFLNRSREISSDKREIFFFAYTGIMNEPNKIEDIKVVTNVKLMKNWGCSASRRLSIT